MDRRKALLNITVSTGFKLITMFLVIVVKRCLIQACGNDVNGLNALYLSIIGFLSVAELGVGSAITFCMYKPIVEGDNNTVSALYQLFKKLYLIIGAVIFTAGLCITPFIKFFAKDYNELDVNLYLTFILMLISVEMTYIYSAKTSLINAYKNNYITTAIYSGGITLQYILQIIVIVITKSYVWYLACRIIAVTVQWVITELIAHRKYRYIIVNKKKVDLSTRKEVVKNIKAMFMHRIGSVLVNTVDGVVISMFVGVVALGEYSNYSTILASITGVLSLVFSSITSIMGHLYVEADKNTVRKYFETFQLLNFILGAVFFLGYFAVIENIIAILFSPELIVKRSIAIVISLNGFIQFMRKNALMFRDATGTFYNDRWKPLIEGITNIVLSVLFVKLIGVVGVIIATIITNLIICDIVEPYVLYKNAFNTLPRRFYLMNYAMIAIFTAGLFVMNHFMQTFENNWIELFVNGCISVVISLLMCIIVLVLNGKLFKDILIELRAGRNSEAVN